MCCFIFLGIKFFFVSQEDILFTEKQLEERFSTAKTIPGTQKLHRFVPVDKTTLNVYDLSQSSISQSIRICDSDGDEGSTVFSSTEILSGSTYSQTRLLSHPRDCEKQVTISGVDIKRSCAVHVVGGRELAGVFYLCDYKRSVT